MFDPAVPISVVGIDIVAKAEIERHSKSRESRCLDALAAAMPTKADTKVRGRFCAKRCGPSHRRVRNASALKNFVRQPEKTFSTVSESEADMGCCFVWSALTITHFTVI